MPVLGITGGPACGKSTFTEALGIHFPTALKFSADAEVRNLTEEDPEVIRQLLALFGEGAYTREGAYNREYVRKAVFSTPSLREGLNAILHPMVRAAWSSLAEKCRTKENWLLVEIPLLYETQGEVLCDRVITVGCSAETQIQRLTALRGLPANLAHQIRVAQSNLQDKINRADHLIWNDCPFNCLTRQAAHCAHWLRKYFS